MKIICSLCRRLIGENEPYEDSAETQAKCSACLEHQRLSEEADQKKLARANVSIQDLLKKEAVVLAVVLVLAFLNRESAPDRLLSYSSLSKTSSYGSGNSSSVSVDFHFSFFWVLVDGYLAYLALRLIYLAIQTLRKKKQPLP